MTEPELVEAIRSSPGEFVTMQQGRRAGRPVKVWRSHPFRCITIWPRSEKWISYDLGPSRMRKGTGWASALAYLTAVPHG